MITLENIKKTYYGKGIQTDVLRGVDLSIKRGEFVCIYGKSGSGKSTLLNILGMLDEATSGVYRFEDLAVEKMKEKEIAKIRNQKIGYVFQAYHLIPELNAIENIVVPLGYAGISRREREKRGKELLSEFQMEELEKKYISQMSGGEQQRISILRAIANCPSILLADEPAGNLDRENSELVMEQLKKLNEEGMTIVMVTHDLSLAEYGTRIITVEDGRVVEQDC